ncbi:glucose 1-dehydrogenase [Streptomyces sp. MNP-20]|uniref:glucose 1-dehydrogenase n=1 Tax=Streptomyces sp. MNP-20 TaxID=2721165 RepID=UPI0015543048|nr:glucose 1-dehydrogenase [Streptomyces sp. MNP-20]
MTGTGCLLLEGKVAVVTGAAAGIGRAAAQVFSAHGARLVLADIDAEGGEGTVALVEQNGGKAVFLSTDVTVADQVDAMVEAAMRTFGRLDCAFNNVGIDGDSAPLAESTDSNWQRVTDVNLTGMYLCMRAELRVMAAQQAGSVVNTSSIAGLVGVNMGLSAYTAAKHGVVGLTKAAALEYADKNIRVNAVCPGAVRTALLDHVIRSGALTEEQARGLQPLGRLGAPHEIAQAAAWLCSDHASFVTGIAMPVDGGATCG